MLNSPYFYSEENTSIPDVGIDMLLKDGKLDQLKAGPVYWVDSSDTHPTIGTASVAVWNLMCKGRLFHSGLPHNVCACDHCVYQQHKLIIYVHDVLVCVHV